MSEYTMEQILAMEAAELSLAVAEHIFQAKIISKENDPDAKLLIGWYGEKAWKPMRHTWHTAVWHRSEEAAWLDCPKFAEDISAAWEVVKHLSKRYGVNVYEDDGAPCECTLVRYPETVAVVGGTTAPEVICKAALLAVMGL